MLRRNIWPKAVLVVLVAYLAGGFGLRLEPGSSEWWLTRLPWLAANAIALVPLVLVFGRFERPRAAEGAPAPAWRYVLGAILTVAGLALLAAQGVGGYGKFGLNVWALALALAGVGLSQPGRLLGLKKLSDQKIAPSWGRV